MSAPTTGAGTITAATTLLLSKGSRMKTRLRFALLPILRFSSEFYQNGCYWLRFVRQRQTPSGWKALEADNR